MKKTALILKRSKVITHKPENCVTTENYSYIQVNVKVVVFLKFFNNKRNNRETASSNGSKGSLCFSIN